MQQFLALIVLIMMFYGCGKLMFSDSSSNNTPPPTTTVQDTRIVATQEQQHEVMQGLNQVLGDVLKPLYLGLQSKGLEKITIYVSDDWLIFNKEQKSNLMDRVRKVYIGMLGARNLRIENQELEIKFMLRSTDKLVGTWDAYHGATVY